ncbi:MAG: hypothetical protein AAGH89_12750 [Verrucomicrobiota bacterium]
MAADSVLKFQDVRLSYLSGKETEGFDLELKPGELALFCSDSQKKTPEIAELSMGLRRPSTGTIEFLGADWARMAAPEFQRYRGQIGRVFTPRGGSNWIQNLDIDENIMVAQFFRPDQTTSMVHKRAQEMGQRLGFEDLPHSRPSNASAEELTRAQWVRAFLPDPLKLLILERPGFHMTVEQMRPLVQQIRRVRDEGTPVLWIDFQRDVFDRLEIEATYRFDPCPEALDGDSQ